MAPSVPENSIVNGATTSGIKKNVVIIGGSCVAISAALTAKNILPSTHRLVIIEKHSHFHYMFAFPRACVISGWENELFVPYTKVFASPEKGEVIQALATNITKTHVELDRTVEGFGTSVEYEYLIYATGARHPEPGNFNDHDTKAEAIQRIKETQEKIQKATKILLIGGGAVGLELAAEIREHYPEKEVTLVHSRERYMPLYKSGMHDKTFGILKEFGVRQILGDRANIPEGGFVDDFKMIKVTTKGGKEIECDLQILCTGMTPQSDLLAKLSPSSINPSNRLVKTKPTLQIDDDNFPNIYTAGDVADLVDVKTGGAAWMESALCMRNICKMINKPGIQPKELETHTPIEPQIMLYLGVAQGIAQFKFFGIFLLTSWSFLVKRFFSYNIGASRAWDWLGTPLSKETADL
ncbi:Apoptosis-inducing factor 2 [Entomortierella lignicola]|nr:Apoptosis-inducing factor 2 [Entomortierella lignicola]